MSNAARLTGAVLVIVSSIAVALLASTLLIALFGFNDMRAGLGGGFAGCWAGFTLWELIARGRVI